MKRAIFLPIVVLVLVSLACSLSSEQPATPTQIPQPDTQGVAATSAPEQPVPTETVPPAEPTTVVEPTTAAAPTVTAEPTATDAPAPTDTPEGPIQFSETFDKRSDDWSDLIIITTQASGRDPDLKATVDRGVMRFALREKESYVYKFLRYSVEGTATIEVAYEPKGAINNGIAVICRADEDLTSWYEMRILSSTGDVHFYRYEKRLKVEENKNPYVLLGKERMKIKEFNIAKANKFVVQCTDDDITMDMNNGKRIIVQPLVDAPLEGRIVGIGAMSYDVVPVTIDFDTVVVTQE
jgi:hypothetical protein